MNDDGDPTTPAEWQEAVDAAHFGLCVDSAFQYGLLERRDEHGRKIAGSGVNVDRCEEILRRGKAFGYFPKPLK